LFIGEAATAQPVGNRKPTVGETIPNEISYGFAESAR